MEPVIFLLLGVLIGFVVTFFVAKLTAKNNKVSVSDYDILKQQLIDKESDFKLLDAKFQELSISLVEHKTENERKDTELLDLQKQISSLETNGQNLVEKAILLQRDMDTLKEEIRDRILKENDLVSNLSVARSQNKALVERLNTQKEEILRFRNESYLAFEKIANQILEEKSSRFTEVNKNNIESILKPISENIDKFKKQVEETYDKESKERFSLGDRIKELVEQTNKISDEANNLATALKGQSKTRGDWGEMILESILQDSGLMKGREYDVQQSLKNDEGKTIKPDILVKLPDNRVVIIDSKVSLVAYNNFYAAESSDEQSVQLNEHVKAIKRHIDELSGKNYDDIEASLDFTMMFVPIEPAYMLAIQYDKELWSYAYSKRILLISPTNLIACLKLIADLWKRELQSKNALEIVRRGELLYSKFVSFTDSILDVGKSLDKTKSYYDSAIKQLKYGSGNLISQATKLKALGLKSDKEINDTLISEEIND